MKGFVATARLGYLLAMLFGRFDGHRVRDLSAYRRMVPFVLRGRNESAVYFEQTVDLTATLPWIDEWNRTEKQRITVFHVVLAALTRVLEERPRLNRFVSGRRLYQRDGIWISFAAKKRFEDDAPLSVVKQRFDPGESFADLVGRLSNGVRDARSDRLSAVDREINLLIRLPGPILDGAVLLLRALDHYNLAPRFLLHGDPMYTSVFVANLGSIDIDAAYHHLYEHGNCPLFVTIGKIDRVAVAGEDGSVITRPVVSLKYTYDERIEDGLYCARSLDLFKRYLEAPSEWLSGPD
ncbi:MAG: 2-oxo acid dehydrogenase subunit E2 [Proteobacteria bacterium]|nr:2-oxo acid dehydrogenase subunit E2 [Pseudomonadota bacterium]